MPLAHSVTEVAEALGIGKTKAWELVNDGTIPTFRVDRRVLVADDDFRSLPDRLRSRSSHDVLEQLLELIDDDGRIDVEQIPEGATLADLAEAKRMVAARKQVA